MPKASTSIRQHAHCMNCARQKPVNQSPSEWSRLDVGLTETGIEVWCKRCRLQVAHFTPEGLAELVAKPPTCDCCPGGKHAKNYPPKITVN